MEEREMKTRIPKRVYTAQFREAAVRQVIEAGRSSSEVARSLDISSKTLGNWVRQARRGKPLAKRAAVVVPVNDAQAELSRLRAENARLKLDNEILKKAAAYFARESG
jgi:transposase